MVRAESSTYREPQLVSVNYFEQLEAFNLGLVSPVDGTIMSVKGGTIRVRSREKGTVASVHAPKNVPLNRGSFIDSEVIVKTGDRVSEGQLLAQNNYTLGAALALGTNLITAIMPYKGKTHEDGIVISDSASRKLTSKLQ